MTSNIGLPRRSARRASWVLPVESRATFTSGQKTKLLGGSQARLQADFFHEQARRHLVFPYAEQGRYGPYRPLAFEKVKNRLKYQGLRDQPSVPATDCWIDKGLTIRIRRASFAGRGSRNTYRSVGRGNLGAATSSELDNRGHCRRCNLTSTSSPPALSYAVSHSFDSKAVP